MARERLIRRPECWYEFDVSDEEEPYICPECGMDMYEGEFEEVEQ